MIKGMVVSFVISFISLYLASKALHVRASVLRLAIVAFLGQIIVPYALGVILPYLSILPFVSIIFQVFIWAGLIKFMFHRASLFEAAAIGIFVFVITYFFGTIGLENFISGLLFG
ncbi:MAG: hypothetical protein ABEJ72_06565 [Candidatus Aenigmatarchaeota archaeon]